MLGTTSPAANKLAANATGTPFRSADHAVATAAPHGKAGLVGLEQCLSQSEPLPEAAAAASPGPRPAAGVDCSVEYGGREAAETLEPLPAADERRGSGGGGAAAAAAIKPPVGMKKAGKAGGGTDRERRGSVMNKPAKGGGGNARGRRGSVLGS